jgi:ribosomal protein L37AE/L43A
MRVPSSMASIPSHIICPFCESGELACLGQDFARCGSCGMPLVGSTLETLREITGLPDALGAHPCECGQSEMRRLPDGVFHCPACRSEVLPIQAPLGEGNTRPGSVWAVVGGTSAQGREAAPNVGARPRLWIHDDRR